MKFDVEEVLAEMLDAAAHILSSEWPTLQANVKIAFEEERHALEAIAQARLEGEIDDADLRAHLADEKEVLKVTLLVCKVRGKVTAQKAANAAIKVFSKSIHTALIAL
ncbi:hypothetical protein C4K04_2679 [Pseudomonas chlororaphis]|uniref:Uncharacterized protein n=1 Tax=Pseudomonas chlororaphis TaxID=587753 RepID=A0A3G7TN91_9PSED|nr:hypothetical protein [Pseudomonas chlororaphis]AZE48351.1 hypothetical protein C4K04_2679 [Pseudomonas chlororaphis]